MGRPKRAPDHSGSGISPGLHSVNSLRGYAVFSRWVSIAPYAGVSASLSRSHEQTSAVTLDDENVWGAQGMVGVVTGFSVARIAVEYSVARVRSLSIKVGVAP